MANKNKAGRETRKPKKDAKVKTVTSGVTRPAVPAAAPARDSKPS